jgi:hypothetical protein
MRLGLTGAARTDLSRWLRSDGGGRLQAKGAATGLLQAAAAALYRWQRLAGRLAGGGQQGLLATKCYRKTTELKRRPRENYLEARKGGKGAGAADPSEGGTLAAVLWRRCCRGVEELRGAVWFGEGARCFLYRAERGAEGARLRRCATGTSAATIDGERLGGHPLQGEEGAGTAWVAPVGCLAHWREGEEARGGERRRGTVRPAWHRE